MKVLFIIEGLRSGGKERRLVELIKGLLFDIELELIILKPEVHYHEIFDLRINIHKLKRDLRDDIKIISKFINILESFNPDIVHCWDIIGALMFAPICKLKKIPFINSTISTAPPRLSRISKKYLIYAATFPFSDIILTNSYAGLHSYNISSKKGYFIHNGFDFNRCNPILSEKETRLKFGITKEFVVGMTASFTNMKDHITFIEAGTIILKKREDTCFVFVGDGPTILSVKEQIPDEHQSKYIFLGKQTDVESIVNIFDIGVLSTFTEGISNSILEYMALKKPVIATYGGGTSEIVLNGITGFLIPPQNPIALSSRMDKLLSDGELRSRMGVNGHKRVMNEFSLAKMIFETKKIYLDLKKVKKRLMNQIHS